MLPEDRDRLESFRELLYSPTYRGVFVESRTADDGQASLLFFQKTWFMCGIGLSTWNPLDRSLPQYEPVAARPLRVADTGGKAGID